MTDSTIALSALRVFIVAGEASGDGLGARLMAGLKSRHATPIRFAGVGGPLMLAEGLDLLFPMADIAVMGVLPVLARLPSILERIRRTVEAVARSRPDALVLIDSPDFCHRVAKRLRARLPDLPIICYVSPTVWAWRPGRARKMARFCDRLLAVLPFEPEVHRLLGGPNTTYVGHPLIERIADYRAADPGRPPPVGRRPLIVVLPGSRHSEVSRLMPPFGAALGLLQRSIGPFDLVLPAVDHVRAEIERLSRDWPVQPRIVSGAAEKLAAMRAGDVALAASGTVTLELALARLPSVVAYRLDWIGRLIKPWIDVPAALRAVVKVRSAILMNLVIGAHAMPEFIDEDCRPDRLAAALQPLLTNTPERRRQFAGFDAFEAAMALPAGHRPGDEAAIAVLEAIAAKRAGG